MDRSVGLKKRTSFAWLFIPFLVLIFLSFALFIERKGISYTVSHKPASFLDPMQEDEQFTPTEDVDPEILVLFDSGDIVGDTSYSTVAATLDNMAIPYKAVDLDDTFEISIYDHRAIIISLVELARIDFLLDELMQWVEDGGKLMFAIRPENTAALSLVAPDLGIADLGKGLTKVNGIEFIDNVLPGTAGMQFGLDYMKHTSLPVTLSDSADLLAVSADGKGHPLIWTISHGEGRIVFINSDQYIDKPSRGLIGAAFSRLYDTFIHPVINASVFYIDDFPAPFPEGKDEKIFSQFNRDIQSFYLNVWWPDMQTLKEKYKLEYSSVVIETYSYQIEPPFKYTAKQDEIFQYFGGLILRDGGEVGLHGFNHIPLCKKEDGKNQVLDYPVWKSTEDMQAAVRELQAFTLSKLPDAPVHMYVPPSNMLCDEARGWLPEVLPNLKIIASIYLPDAKIPGYVQEFEEAPDGVIEFPRIASGYAPDNFMYWAAANEMWLHYTAGHFVHPDDVLDSYRSKDLSWTDMRETLDEYLLWLYSAMPNVRNLTASEGGMAVQRYARVMPSYECSLEGCQVDLENFYDEAWFLMHTGRTPIRVINGDFSRVGEDRFLIEALSNRIFIEFEAEG